MARETLTSGGGDRKGRNASARSRHALAAATAAGLAGPRKARTHMSLRIETALLAAAAKRTGISSRTELIRTAVAHLATDEAFGDWLIANRGRIDTDVDLGI